jgi:hypothetical protein
MNENVRIWMFNSWKAWKAGLLQDILPDFKESANGEFENFMIGADAQYTFMTHLFFKVTVPLPDEFLLFYYKGTGKFKEKMASVLTSKRLWLVDRLTSQLTCIGLDDIKDFKCRGGSVTDPWISIIYKNGTEQEYKKKAIYPSEKVLRTAFNLCNNPEKSAADVSDLSASKMLLNVPASTDINVCAVCSKAEMGNTPHRLKWVVLKKTGETLKHHATFTGRPMGGVADIWAYKADPAGRIVTSVCTDCQNTITVKASDQTKLLADKRIQDIEKSKRISRVVAIIALVLFIMTLFYIQFIRHWSEDDFSNVPLLFLPIIGVIAFIFSKAKYGTLTPLEESTEAGIIISSLAKAHDDQLQKFVTESPEFRNAVILKEDKCPALSDGGKDLFIMSLRRYELDEYQGYALFNMEKTQFTQGGSEKSEMSYSQLKDFTRNVRTEKDHTMNLGEYMVKCQE